MFLVFEQHSYRTVLLRMKQRRATTALLMDKTPLHCSIAHSGSKWLKTRQK